MNGPICRTAMFTLTFTLIDRLGQYMPPLVVAASALLMRERGAQHARTALAGVLLIGLGCMLIDTYLSGGRWADLTPLEGEQRFAEYALVTG